MRKLISFTKVHKIKNIYIYTQLYTHTYKHTHTGPKLTRQAPNVNI